MVLTITGRKLDELIKLSQVLGKTSLSKDHHPFSILFTLQEAVFFTFSCDKIIPFPKGLFNCGFFLPQCTGWI
jgi:hypothetical protein